MVKIHLITYANEIFVDKQKDLAKKCNLYPDWISHSYAPSDIEKTLLYEHYKDILNQKRGAGYWLWKPWIILNTLYEADENDVIFYIDAGDIFDESIDKFIKEEIVSSDKDIFCIVGDRINEDYTKRDCFVGMGCDNAIFHNCLQLEAGVLIIKNTAYAKNFIKQWLQYCCDSRLLTDIPNQLGLENFESFKDHRHDQSILTNMVYADIFVFKPICLEHRIRNFVKCNA